MPFVIWVHWFNKYVHNIEHVLYSCNVLWLSNVFATPESYTVFVCLEVSAVRPPYDCGCIPVCIVWISCSSNWSILYTDFLCEWTVVKLDVHVKVKKKNTRKKEIRIIHISFIIPQEFWHWICCFVVILHFCAQSFINLLGHVNVWKRGIACRILDWKLRRPTHKS